MQIPEDNRQGEPGIALAVAAQIKLKADIAEERKAGAVMANAKTKVGDLLALVQQDYGRKGRKSISHVQTRWNNHLKSFFADLWANQLSSDDIDRYIALRQKQKAANATICRELSLIRRMLRLGMRGKSPKVRIVPHFDMPKEAPARQGFVPDATYDKLAQECSREGLWLRGMFSIGGSFAWRKSEILNLRVGQLDFTDRTIRLNQGETKNDDPRVIKMTKDAYHILAACVAGKGADDFVFTRDSGGCKGKPVRDFRLSWKRACDAAGCPKLLFHDGCTSREASF